MKKLITFILVLCLIGESAPVSAFPPGLAVLPSESPVGVQSLFHAQALASRALGTLAYLGFLMPGQIKITLSRLVGIQPVSMPWDLRHEGVLDPFYVAHRPRFASGLNPAASPGPAQDLKLALDALHAQLKVNPLTPKDPPELLLQLNMILRKILLGEPIPITALVGAESLNRQRLVELTDQVIRAHANVMAFNREIDPSSFVHPVGALLSLLNPYEAVALSAPHPAPVSEAIEPAPSESETSALEALLTLSPEEERVYERAPVEKVEEWASSLHQLRVDLETHTMGMRSVLDLAWSQMLDRSLTSGRNRSPFQSSLSRIRDAANDFPRIRKLELRGLLNNVLDIRLERARAILRARSAKQPSKDPLVHAPRLAVIAAVGLTALQGAAFEGALEWLVGIAVTAGLGILLAAVLDSFKLRARLKKLPVILQVSTLISVWLTFFLGVSYLDSEWAHPWVAYYPALLIPSLIPVSVASVFVSWQITRILAHYFPGPNATSLQNALRPLLLLALYSAFVEGPLWDWFLHEGIPVWVRTVFDVFVITLFFADPAATYWYKRFQGFSHQAAAAYVDEELSERVLPLLLIWSFFSAASNSLSDSIASFTVFSSGIIAWTIFFIWADDVKFPAGWEKSPEAWKRKAWSINRTLSWPLRRVFKTGPYRAMLRDVPISLVLGFIAASVWLTTTVSGWWMAGVFFGTALIWKLMHTLIEMRSARRANEIARQAGVTLKQKPDSPDDSDDDEAPPSPGPAGAAEEDAPARAASGESDSAFPLKSLRGLQSAA